MSKHMRKIVVIGGGISGLTTAWKLSQDINNKVTILESSDLVGGCIQTEVIGKYLVEKGPNGFLVNQPYVWNLIHEVGLEKDLVPGSTLAGKNRFLWKNAKLQKLPGSILGFLFNPILSLSGRIRVLYEPLIPSKKDELDESIHAFSLRRLGTEATDTLLDPFVSGIHAGDPQILSSQAGFPRLTALEKRFGSIFMGLLRGGLGKANLTKGIQNPNRSRIWSLKHGMGQLVKKLESGSFTLIKNCLVRGIESQSNGTWLIHLDAKSLSADVVIMACPPGATSGMLQKMDPEAAGLFAQIPANTLAVVVFAFKREQVKHPLDGFGYLIPSNENRDILGVQWCSSIYPGRAPEGQVLLRVLVGGMRRPDLAKLPMDQLEQLVFENVARDLTISGQPEWVETKIWNPAIPQYQVGHLDLVKKIRDVESRWRTLFFIGNGLGGISLNDCVRNAEECANRICAIPVSIP